MKGWAKVGVVPLLALTITCGLAKPSPTPAPTPTAPPPTATASPTASPTATSTIPKPTPTRMPSPSPTATPKPPAPFADSSGLIVHGPLSSNKVAFTLDMGSVGGSTQEVLDVLRAHNVKATFFVTGAWADANPSLLKAIVAAGHELGNHSYSHPDFTTISSQEMLQQLARTEDAVKRIVNGRIEPYFRPPFGAYNGDVLRTAQEAGYKVIYWTLDSTDWRDDSTAASVTARVLRYAEPGTILVMHGSLKKTALALAEVIEPLRQRGLRPTFLTDLLNG